MPLPQPVFSLPETQSYDGGPGDYVESGHQAALSLASGTLSVGFTMDGTQGSYALVSKDSRGNNDGEFTVWINDGELKVVLEEAGASRSLNIDNVQLEAGVEYQFAMSFGADGLSLWLNGSLVAADAEFMGGLDGNSSGLLIGASRAWTSGTEAHSMFRGEIGHVNIYDQQLGEGDMMALAAGVSPVLDDAARMADIMDDLAPVFAQVHHASGTFQNILDDYGVDAHGQMSQPLAMQMGNGAANTLTGSAAADGLNGYGGNDTIDGLDGDDVLQGGYGNDSLMGGAGNDILDGGHGEDVLIGGEGNDLLISRADAREPEVAYDPNRDEGDPNGELTDGKLYPDQPIPGNDVLVGGGGADIFYFQTLINAKERFIREHTRDDGTINWHGVAGENANIHDHWVDYLGHDVVMDFSRAEGDRIVIEGHTTQISSITYGDANGDGVMDHSIISLYSDQGSGGGAHNDDELGTITVYGDLVRMADIEHTAAPAYGIITSIEDLQEALQPETNGTSTGPIQTPADLGSANEFMVGSLAPVLVAAGEFDFQPQHRSPLILDHAADASLSQGTIALSFNATNLWSTNTLFSKDASGYGQGGHVTAYIKANGDLVVRIQSDDATYYLTAQGAVDEGQTYDFAFTFGPDGAELYLDGIRLARITESPYDLTTNGEALVIGASNWSSTPGQTDSIGYYFDGVISNVVVYDVQLNGDEIPSTAPTPPVPPAAFAIDHLSADCEFSRNSIGELVVTCGSDSFTVPFGALSVVFLDVTIDVTNVMLGTSRVDAIDGGAQTDILVGMASNDELNGHAENDLLKGGAGTDTLDGGAGDDTLIGGAGADQLFGQGGNDTASYQTASGGVRADLFNSATNQGEAAGDSYVSVENLIGSGFDDRLHGDAGANQLEGGSGDDTLLGRQGDDVLIGGAGADQMHGQGGNDTFVFADGFGTDMIFDFSALNDLEKIDLSAVSEITDFADLRDNHMTQVNSDVVITAPGGNTITLVNVDLGDLLDGNDFLF